MAMNPLKRIALSLTASVDQFVEQIENHEAIAASAIREIESAASKARVQSRRLELDRERTSKRITVLKEERARWIERARRVHATSDADREKNALECVRRSRDIDREIEALTAQNAEQASLAQKLAADLRQIDERLGALRLKRNQLATRQAQAEAVDLINRVDSGTVHEIDGIFDRWESVIACLDGAVLSIADSDPVASRFKAEEDEAELKRSLEELLKEQS